MEFFSNRKSFNKCVPWKAYDSIDVTEEGTVIELIEEKEKEFLAMVVNWEPVSNISVFNNAVLLKENSPIDTIEAGMMIDVNIIFSLNAPSIFSISGAIVFQSFKVISDFKSQPNETTISFVKILEDVILIDSLFL